MPDETQRELGALDARMAQTERRLDNIDKHLEQILEMVNKAKGGWLAVVALGGVAGAIGGAVSKVIAAFAGKGLP